MTFYNEKQVNPHERSRYLSRLMLEQLKDGINEAIALEHKFHPDRKFRFDLALLRSKIGIEIHGGIFTQGRHTRGTGFKNDRDKMNEAQGLGWKVFEFIAEDVENGKAANAALKYYRAMQEAPSISSFSPDDGVIKMYG